MQVGGGTKAHRVRINLSTCWLKSTLPPPTEAPPPPTEAPTFIVVAIYDPRFRQPGLLAWPPRHGGRALHGLYWERWPVEQIPSSRQADAGQCASIRVCVRELPATTGTESVSQLFLNPEAFLTTSGNPGLGATARQRWTVYWKLKLQ